MRIVERKLRGMDYARIAEKVRRIENLKAFAAASGVSRRTLVKIKGDDAHALNLELATLIRIEGKLRELRPKLRPAPAMRRPEDDEAHEALDQDAP